MWGSGEKRLRWAGGRWSAQNGAVGVDNGRWAVLLLTLADHGAGRQAGRQGEPTAG